MVSKNKKIIIIVIFLICIIFSSISILAQGTHYTYPEKLAVSLVIDTSGSMKATDPQRLREAAANIFIDLLSPDDYLSIITFNSKDEVVLPMQKIQSVGNKAVIKNMLSQKLQASGDTDYLTALTHAGAQLNSINEENLRKVIIFLTDGKPDPDSAKSKDVTFMNSYMDSLWKAVSNLALNKYSVYSVGFSREIDPGILEKISGSTQGTVKISEDSSELVLNFFNILVSLKNSTDFLNKTLELKGSSSLEFDMDAYTSQTVMVFTNTEGANLNVTLTPPEGKSVKDEVVVNKSDRYSIVIINQKDKELAGKWKVNLNGSGRINAFGSKDLFIRPFTTSTESGSLELPSISAEFLQKDTMYRRGHKAVAASYLVLEGSKLLNDNELKIENYNLVLEYMNKGTQTIPLLDNGSEGAGDAKANDGVWSNNVLFDKEDEGKASIIVNGSYKGQDFLIEKSMGSFKVYPFSITAYLSKYLKYNLNFVTIFAAVFAGILLLVIFPGLFFYMVLVYKNTKIRGKLIYWNESHTEAENRMEFNFERLRKNKIVISFNEDNKNAQYHIQGSENNYDMELTAIVKKSRWKFIDGLKALFGRRNSSEVLLRTTEPGIFDYNGKIYTSKKIYNNDRFSTGRYVFEYVVNSKVKTTDMDESRNMLKKLESPVMYGGK